MPRESAVQRTKEYRERIKEARVENDVPGIIKTGAQRSKEWRQRKRSQKMDDNDLHGMKIQSHPVVFRQSISRKADLFPNIHGDHINKDSNTSHKRVPVPPAVLPQNMLFTGYPQLSPFRQSLLYAVFISLFFMHGYQFNCALLSRQTSNHSCAFMHPEAMLL
ncbi:hypothetical protein QAD02_008007 [Eretmocerus hayati]|uniref:Uncharacterized protein n=1 Tax=Eretmocerus hayati TaxID=131215 RepID=A0ACC2N9L6_9HYME|nr:hypothetical protein QAD02_008007 [Eretmocerus hayati]